MTAQFSDRPLSLLELELLGQIRSKKNRYQFNGKTKAFFKDKIFTDWNKDAALQIKKQLPNLWEPLKKVESIDITFQFGTMHRKDISNSTESLNDLLVDCGVILDDSWTVVPQLMLRAHYSKNEPKAFIRIAYIS
jgi:Holliday junction resolvase RusA-like endonuclease